MIGNILEGSVYKPSFRRCFSHSFANEEKPAIVAKEALAPIFKNDLLLVMIVFIKNFLLNLPNFFDNRFDFAKWISCGCLLV
jgi:hypothetical protein